MPTGAKLTGAVVFFAVGWLAALFVIDTFPEGTPATYFPLTIALIGLWQGWMVAGAHAGNGYQISMGAGLRTSVQIAFFGLLLFALRTMFMRSARLRYDGPGEATIAALELFLEYLLQSLTPEIWGTLILGGLIGGAICEWAARRWR